MDEKKVDGSYVVVSEERRECFYPIYFGVSCAFFALKVLSRDDKEDTKWSEFCKKMLQGSAQLLGLLIWRIQKGVSSEQCVLLKKLEVAEKEIKELKKMRHEDAKANEKVVGIFASQEQSWLFERKKLQQHIGLLMKELKAFEKRKEESISEMNHKLKEMEVLVQSKDKLLDEQEYKRKELEEKLTKAENIAEELRESAKRQAQEHSTDIWKHKTAFLELVSNQRQLEAEMRRVLAQLDAKRQELDSVLEQKEQSVLLAQKLSMEVLKMRKDLEQKDKVLSAMLRKSKLDTAEKQMLLKELKLSKAKRKQAELETERWKVASESRHERHSLRNMLANSRADNPSVARGQLEVGKGRSLPADCDLEYKNSEFTNDSDSHFSDHYSPEGNDELGEAKVFDLISNLLLSCSYSSCGISVEAIAGDAKQLEGWVRSEAEKYASAIDKRNGLEIDAFVEQLRLKDEKLEAFRWRMLSMEIETKRLQSHIEGLSQDVSQLRHENMKLEAVLLQKQEELNALREQLMVQTKQQICHKTNSALHDPGLAHDAIWSKVKVAKKKLIEKDQEMNENSTEMSVEKDTKKEEDVPYNPSKNVILIVQSPEKEFEEGKDIHISDSTQGDSKSTMEIDTVEKLAIPSQSLTKTNNRMDLHALGVSYKIKRLKQQLLLLERLTGKQESGEDAENNDNSQNRIEGFLSMVSLLNKQVGRYQTLQGKTDELCKRMQESDVQTSHGDTKNARKKDEMKTLEHFLEETFQVQRYMVATGQKLIEVQSKIASGFVQVPEELDKSASVNSNRFADNIRSLFQEVQRGLEVRIARIIGDLEGTLACQGMIGMRR